MGKGRKNNWRKNSWKFTKFDENYKPLDVSSSKKFKCKREKDKKEEEVEEEEEEEKNYTKHHNNKIFKTSTKNETLKEVNYKRHIMYWETKLKMSADYSSKTTQVEKKIWQYL